MTLKRLHFASNNASLTHSYLRILQNWCWKNKTIQDGVWQIFNFPTI